jgi:hypothetical protein
MNNIKFEELIGTVCSTAHLEELGVYGSFEKRMELYGMDLCGSEQGPVADCFKYDDKSSVSMNVRIFLKYTSDYWTVKMEYDT